MDKVGAMSVFRENDPVDAYQMHGLLTGDASLREAVLAQLRPVRDEVLVHGKAQQERSRQLHADREERRAEANTYQAAVSAEAAPSMPRRFFSALGSLTSKLTRS